MNRTLTVDAAARLLSAKRCPDCSSDLYATEGIVSEVYLQNGVHYRGDELPRRERSVTLLCCSGCEFTKEITR